MILVNVRWQVPILLLVCTVRTTMADDAENRAADFAKLIRTVASFTITADGTEAEKLSLDMPAALRYSDGIQSDIHIEILDGAIFAWTRKGKPEALISMHTGSAGTIWTEFRSLTQFPLVATRHSQTIWSSKQPGAEFQPIRNAPEAAKTAPFRLAQMHSLLNLFSASVADQRSGRQELRLLPKPLLRYSQPENGILDGAVFVFARGTNPEMMVMLEARTEKDNSQWVYAPIRYSGRAGEMKCPDDRVWTHGQYASKSTDTFYQLNIDPEPEDPPK